MGAQAIDDEDRAMARQRAIMVMTQLQTRGIHDPDVLAAMGTVPRERFVRPAYRDFAYDDRPLPIDGATISQPYIVAYMTELAEVGPGSRVLEIGTGSGYQAAILAELGAEVYTIELRRALAKEARATIEALGYRNVHVRVGNGFWGWPEEAPFDAILLTAAPTRVPDPLLNQLAEGGRLVAPVGRAHHQTLRVYRRLEDRLHERQLEPVAFVPFVRPTSAHA